MSTDFLMFPLVEVFTETELSISLPPELDTPDGWSWWFNEVLSS